MSYKVLYRKYRPDTFENVVGQDYTVKMLKNAIVTGRNSHAYIFTGPRGTGKTSSAKIFAKALNCDHPIDGNPCGECPSCLSFKDSPDIIEIDAASNNGVDEIRELINNVKLVPSNLRYKVYIIDEVHMLSTSAFNALLLTLEEPPSHVVFILATTDIQDVPITILSRCQRFDFKPISRQVLVDRLSYVCKEESIKITDDAINEIALISAGGMRDALGMLDQLSSVDEEITSDLVMNYFGSVSIEKINELLTAIGTGNIDKLVTVLGNIKSSGTNYAVFIEKVIDILRSMAINLKKGNDCPFDFDTIYSLIFDLNSCLKDVNINIDPYSLIEIVFLKYTKSDSNIIAREIISDEIVSNEKVDIVKEQPETEEKIEINRGRKKKEEVINNVVEETLGNKISIDVDVRINNCFVDCTKDLKAELISSWVDFMNFLMKKDRNLLNLLVDTSVLAASNRYVLIQSKTDSANDLINAKIQEIEDYYKKYSKNDLRFCAVNSELWKKETEKYRFNLKNKIKYEYIEEESSNIDNQQNVDKSDIESVATDIFGTFEVE